MNALTKLENELKEEITLIESLLEISDIDYDGRLFNIQEIIKVSKILDYMQETVEDYNTKEKIEDLRIDLETKKDSKEAELSGIQKAKKILLNDEITWLISLNHDLKECDLTNIYPTEGYRLDEWIDKRITKLKQSLSSEEKT